MALTGFHHVAVIASDFARSRRFYVEVLGLAVIREVYRAERASHKCDLALPGGGMIELFSFPNPPARLSYPEACGLRHLALSCDGLDGEVARITGLGVAVEPARVLRRSRINHDGFIRDTAVFSITDQEWPGVRAGLEGLLSAGERGAR
ncbi:MAG: VOC family protein [Phycisphaerales bacterium]